MQTKVAELYGVPTSKTAPWSEIASKEECPFLGRKCLKNRKSDPDLTIGTCTVIHGIQEEPIMVCPFRMTERSQVFVDCIHLLSVHEPGNELRLINELAVPGGSIDYCLVSVRDGKPRDFVGIEVQTLDTTGTIWPERQRFLYSHGIKVNDTDVESEKPFGMNWKMTAKTTLVQLSHKIATFETLSKRLVLVLQRPLLDYLRREFTFDHVKGQRDGDPMQFHSYEIRAGEDSYSLRLRERLSTDSAGVAACLGLQVGSSVALQEILDQISAKLPQSTLLLSSGNLGS